MTLLPRAHDLMVDLCRNPQCHVKQINGTTTGPRSDLKGHEPPHTLLLPFTAHLPSLGTRSIQLEVPPATSLRASHMEAWTLQV